MNILRNWVILVWLMITLICLSGVVLADSEGNLTLLNLPMLEDLDVDLAEDVIQIKLTFSQDVEYTDLALENPSRIVIDIRGGWHLTEYKQDDYNDPLLRQVRFFQYQDGLRIVAELKYNGPVYDLHWEEGTKQLILTIDRNFSNRVTTILGTGVKYHFIQSGNADGPVNIHVLEVAIDPHIEGRKILQEIGSANVSNRINLRTTFREGSLRGFNKISDLVAQEGALAGINGGYFGPDGMPLGLLIQDGQLASAPVNNRTAWGIDSYGRMVMEQVSLVGEVVHNFFNRKMLSGINRPRYDDELILYTPTYGRRTNTNQWGAEIVVENNRITQITSGNSPIPHDGFVISAHGSAREFMNQARIGDLVQTILNMTPDWLNEGIVQAIGGGPRLVKDGSVCITGEEERFLPDILYGRAPRSALGITLENHLLMVTVDGRSSDSIGMTLEELADLMLSLGAFQAMNLDGGKSSTLVIRDKILNVPPKGEISVHNGLILKVEGIR